MCTYVVLVVRMRTDAVGPDQQRLSVRREVRSGADNGNDERRGQRGNGVENGHVARR